MGQFDADRYYREMLEGEHLNELTNLTDNQLEQLCVVGMQYDKTRGATGQLNDGLIFKTPVRLPQSNFT